MYNHFPAYDQVSIQEIPLKKNVVLPFYFNYLICSRHIENYVQSSCEAVIHTLIYTTDDTIYLIKIKTQDVFN